MFRILVGRLLLSQYVFRNPDSSDNVMGVRRGSGMSMLASDDLAFTIST